MGQNKDTSLIKYLFFPQDDNRFKTENKNSYFSLIFQILLSSSYSSGKMLPCSLL